MIRSYDSHSIELTHRPLSPKLAITEGVTSAVAALDTEGDIEVGVWEHSIGESTDIEVEEVFVVVSGKGTVTCEQGGVIDLAPGTIGILPAGSRTTWKITETMRKVWITLS
jgi:uncharacterized cupin superfamily protein